MMDYIIPEFVCLYAPGDPACKTCPTSCRCPNNYSTGRQLTGPGKVRRNK